MVRVGICGLGFMGMIHFQAYQRLAAAKVVALCDPDQAKLAGDWTSIQGNFGPRGAMMDLSAYQRYARFEEVLASKEIDLIDICSPTEFHAPMTQQALAAGKHVFVEKPICLSAADADACLAAAQKSDKLLMVGQVLPFFPEFKYALDYVRSGQGGKLLGAHLSRLMCKPTWRKGPQLDGPAVDLHIHDNHFICLLTGTPRSVRSRGMVDSLGVVQHVETQYLYDSPSAPFMTASSGSLYQPGWPFSHGYTIFLEKTTLAFDSLGVPLTLLTQDGNVEKPNLGISGDPVDAFAAELTEVINSVKTATPSALLNGRLGRDALVMSLSEEESVKTGREVAIMSNK